MLSVEKIRQLLDREGAKLIAQIQANMVAEGVNASGESSDSLYSETTSTLDGNIKFQIIGNEAFRYMEGGRGPTRQSEGGVLYEQILDWVFAKGIDIEDESPEAVAAKITRTIHNSGTLLHRLKETRDIYTSVFSDNVIDELENKITEEIGFNVETVFFNHWKI